MIPGAGWSDQGYRQLHHASSIVQTAASTNATDAQWRTR